MVDSTVESFRMRVVHSLLTAMEPSAFLTPRQRRMLEKLISLYREAREPMHYSALARHLGIGNTAAYEMLRLLEREGYVKSDYVLSGNVGPGRSSVVFAPTPRAHAALRLSTDKQDVDSEWDRVKKQILSRLGQDEDAEQVLFEELVSRLPNVEEPLIYCAEALAALFLNIGREARQRLHEQEALLQQLIAASPVRNLLSLLPGLALGLALPGQVRRLSERLIEYSEAYQLCLQQLDEAKQKALAEFVRQALDSLPTLSEPEGPEQHGNIAASHD